MASFKGAVSAGSVVGGNAGVLLDWIGSAGGSAVDSNSRGLLERCINYYS